MSDIAGPLAVALQRLSETAREELAATLATALEPFVADGGYTIPGAARVAAANSTGRT
jgi:hypothetical protein